MYIGRIYVQDNFVPDPQFDQFRRRVIGIDVMIKEGESEKEAEAKGEAYIKDYISRNSSKTPIQECRGVDEKIIVEHSPAPVPPAPSKKLLPQPRPDPKVFATENLINEINACLSYEDLITFNTMAVLYNIVNIYDKKFMELKPKAITEKNKIKNTISQLYKG